MTILATQLFEESTDGVTVTSALLGGSPWSYLGGAGTDAVFSSAAAIHGSYAMRIADMDHQHAAKYDHGSAIASYCNSFYFRLDTLPTANSYLGQVNDNSNTKICDWRINPTTGFIVLRNNASLAVYTSGVGLSASTVYRAEHLVTASAQELKIFVGENTSALIDSGSQATGTTNTGRYSYCGLVAVGATTGELDVDTWQIADTWTGPYVTFTPYHVQIKQAGGSWAPAVINIL